MKTLFRIVLFGAICTLSTPALGPPTAQADDYWTNHWNWYDNTYQPYYYRSYAARPAYGTYSGPAYYQGYAPGYYGPGYSNYGYNTYGPAPYRTYYGTPGVGYGRTYGGRQAVQVGPLSFGWR
jgi:hypothetical protein